MTYAELKTAIGNWLNRSDLTSHYDTFIDNAEAEFNRTIRHRDMIKRSTATADSQYLTLPTDWLEAINVKITAGTYRPLFQVSIETGDVIRNAKGNSSGDPAYFSIVDGTLELIPTPSSSTTLELIYYSKIEALSDSNTTNWLSTSHPDIYLYGALKQASVFLMEDERVPLLELSYKKGIQELEEANERAKYSDGSLVKRVRTYGHSSRTKTYYANT
tara:strand:+ start:282 stop:932 length:651 start_codon:yes stop_codon:yes gene_type:complete